MADSGGRFLLIARLLGDKGIREYASAAKEIRKILPAAEFHLVGPFDPNPATISKEELESWQRDGVIIYHGAQDDVRPFLRACTVYVLPSYREGTPRTVLEAMATGRPIITTDAAGCRETIFEPGLPDSAGIRQGRNGFLVPVRSIGGLVAAMQRFIDDPRLAVSMGAEGRRLAQQYYDVHRVNLQMMEFMDLAAGGDSAQVVAHRK
jgi:glycosyltransferase involved in cell wall biosynthesis